MRQTKEKEKQLEIKTVQNKTQAQKKTWSLFFVRQLLLDCG